MSTYEERREDLKKAERYKHIFLTNDNALQTIEDALGAIVVAERAEERIQAFGDCTVYWQNVVKEILKEEDDDPSAIIKIMKAFNLDKKEDA